MPKSENLYLSMTWSSMGHANRALFIWGKGIPITSLAVKSASLWLEKAQRKSLWLSSKCYIIAEGFRFMPLSLVRLRTFRLGTWVSWRCHSDVIIVRDKTGWQGAGDVTHRKRVEVCVRFEESKSWVLDAKREGSTFGARRREANLRHMGAARDGVQMNKTV